MTMYRLALRSLLFRRRSLAIALAPFIVGLMALGTALAAPRDELMSIYATLGADLYIALAIALVSLVIGVNAFDDEREGGTLPLLLATCTPRWRIVGAKLAGAWTATMVLCIPALLGCGVLGVRAGFDAAHVWASLLLTTVGSSAGYVALFVLLSLVSARSLLVGLAYIVVWEGLLAAYATALRNLSVAAYGRRLFGLPWEGTLPFSTADSSAPVTVAVLAGLALVAWLLATRQLFRVDALS